MYAARRFQYYFDVLSIGQSPVISFYDLSELNHSAGSFDILSEAGSPAKDSRLLVNSTALHCVVVGRQVAHVVSDGPFIDRGPEVCMRHPA